MRIIHQDTNCVARDNDSIVATERVDTAQVVKARSCLRCLARSSCIARHVFVRVLRCSQRGTSVLGLVLGCHLGLSCRADARRWRCPLQFYALDAFLNVTCSEIDHRSLIRLRDTSEHLMLSSLTSSPRAFAPPRVLKAKSPDLLHAPAGTPHLYRLAAAPQRCGSSCHSSDQHLPGALSV